MSGKFYVCVDLEGVACTIGRYGQGLAAGTPEYAFACRQATDETSALLGALRRRGVDDAIVWDCHGTGYNLDYHALEKAFAGGRLRFALGAGSRKRLPGLDASCDGLFFLGYHAYDAKDATLCHVYSSATFAGMRVNGKPVGELQIDAAVAGRLGVPVKLVASDDICVAQARETFPDAEFVVTKQSLAWNSCLSESPGAVCRALEKAASRAVDRNGTVFTFPSPFEFAVSFKRIEYAQGCALHGVDGEPFGWDGAYTRVGQLRQAEDIFTYI